MIHDIFLKQLHIDLKKKKMYSKFASEIVLRKYFVRCEDNQIYSFNKFRRCPTNK